MQSADTRAWVAHCATRLQTRAFGRSIPTAILLLQLHWTSVAQAPPFTPQQICRATVAAVMGRPPSIVQVDRTIGEVVYVTYLRPDDGTRWNNRCKFEGSKVVWATDVGRWRTHPDEAEITFSANASTLTITEAYRDGSMSRKRFTREQLAPR